MDTNEETMQKRVVDSADQRSAVITERLQSVARESGVATSTLTVIIVLVLIVAAAVVLVVNNGIARRSAELAAASQGPPTIAPQPQPAPEIIKQPAQSVFEGGLTSGHEDANMQAIAKERLNEDLELGGVVTTVNDARAVLTGAVGSEAAKAKAEQLVKGVRGVKSVDNKIVVSSWDRNDRWGTWVDQEPNIHSLDQEFRDLDRGWVAAYLQGSSELFDRIWTEGFLFTFPFGKYSNKKQEISNIDSGSVAFNSMSSDNLTVRVYGNTAVMAGDFKIQGRYEDRDISGQYGYTNVLKKRHDKLWQIVASQANLLA
jgi:uncharacterized protein DUF4440/BON domain-containing protein